MAAGRGVLHGLCVVEIGTRIGAAVCGSLLAQLGATVVAVESTSSLPVSKAHHREQLVAGKLSFAPNVADPADRQLTADILACADVIIASSDTDRVDLQSLVSHRSDQIVCDVTAFGQGGPLAGRPCLDAEIQALTGMADTTGLPDEPPVATALPLVEHLAGMHAAGAVVAAVRSRRLNGTGQPIDIALHDCAFAAMSSFLTRLLHAGEAADIRRLGNRHALSAPWNVYRAQDGWLLICTGSDVQWRRLCALMGRPELATDDRFATSVDRVKRVAMVDAEVQSWVGGRSVAECVDALASASIPSGPIAPIERFPREANLDYRRMICRVADPDRSNGVIFVPGSPLAMNRTPGLSPTRLPRQGEDRAAVEDLVQKKKNECGRSPSMARERTSTMPLSGVRVIEIGHYTTAPVAARFLASIGAEVIKVEPPDGEASRAWPPIDRGQSVFYTVNNSDKRAVTLDLNTESGCRSLRRLLQSADVLIENLKPGTLARRGFAPADLERLNPRLVYCAISGFGANSLYPGRPAFDTVVQAMSGLMDLIRSGGSPVKTGISTADVMGAAIAVLSVLAALEWRDATGVGQSVDLSMQDIVAWATQTAWNGKADSAAGWQAVACRDGYALEFEPDASRTGARDITRCAFVEERERCGARVVPVLSPAEMMAAEQTRARRLYLTVSDERGEWPALATTLRLLGTPSVVARPGPALGCDNAAILGPLSSSDVSGKSTAPSPAADCRPAAST